MSRGSNNSNVVNVRASRQATFYVYLIKQMFHNDEHSMIELHGVGDPSINKVVRIMGILSQNGYVTISRIKTSTLHGAETKLAKMVVHLKKSDGFEESYKKFEEAKAARREAYDAIVKACTSPRVTQEEEEEEQETAPQTISTSENAAPRSAGSNDEVSSSHSASQE